MTLLYTARLSEDAAALSAAGDELAARLEAHGADAAAIYAAQVVLEELGTNVIRYAYPAGAPCWLEVRVNAAEGCFTIEVEDGGVAFNPLEHPVPDTTLPLEERAIGGLGIHLVRQMMDAVEYERVAGRNRVRATRQLQA